MAKVLQIAGSGNINLTAGSVNFLALRGGTVISTTAAGASAKIKYYATGTLSRFSCYFSSNNDTNTETITLTKNAAVSGNQALSITASTTGLFQDASNTDAVTNADDWYAATSSITAAKTLTLAYVSTVFDATSNTVSKTANAIWSGVSGPIANPTSSSTTFAAIPNGGNTATEANTQIKMATAGTFKNAYARVFTNTRSTTTTIGTRINGSNGTLACSVTAATTGSFADTTHSDSVVVTDLCNYYVTAGAL